MKTSTFLSKVLNKFHDGKSYTTSPNRKTWKNSDPLSPQFNVRTTAAAKGRTNLAGMLEKVAKEAGVTTTKAKLAICNSLGHTSFESFAKSKNIKFKAVKAVLQAAIRRSREQGD